MDKSLDAALKLIEKGVIEIRSDGSVWRLKHGKGGRGWRVCKPYLAGSVHSHSKYRVISWMEKGTFYTVRAHRLVYVHFFGMIPEGYEIHHKNNNKIDNRPENLEVVTHKVNMRRAADDGLYPDKNGSNNPCARVDETIIERACKELVTGETVVVVAREMGIGKHILYNVLHGRTWGHLQCVQELLEKRKTYHHITLDMVERICELLVEGKKRKEVSTMLGVPVSTIANIIGGQAWGRLECVKKMKSVILKPSTRA